jgi:hypothetical protein
MKIEDNTKTPGVTFSDLPLGSVFRFTESGNLCIKVTTPAGTPGYVRTTDWATNPCVATDSNVIEYFADLKVSSI